MNKPKTIDEYILSFPKDIQALLQELRLVIRHEIPDAEETISYGLPAFKKDGKYIIYLSAWKKHISLYPYSSDMEKMFPETKDFVISGKGTIQFPYVKKLPLSFIRRIVQYRLKAEV